MNYEKFQESLHENQPPAGLNEILEGLWYDAKGDWEAAHNVAQSREGTKAYDLLHAYLHRVEGDARNANYWYRRAGSKMPGGSLSDEWDNLVKDNM